jgi:hypothetical protein
MASSLLRCIAISSCAVDWEKHGVPAVPTDIEASLQRARAKHPDFAAWYGALKADVGSTSNGSVLALLVTAQPPGRSS